MSLSDLPYDELLRYAQAMGSDVGTKTPQDELLRLVRERQDLLDSLDRTVLIELIKWTRRAVHENAGKEELAREIAASKKMTFDGLSHSALYALARLRNLDAGADEPEAALLKRLKKAERFGDKLRRKRNTWLGGLIGRYVLGTETNVESTEEYKFLPPDQRGPTLKEEIEERGLIGGLTGRIRGAADDYVKEKLDEIERRIDRKLEEIDRRLGEWRDRELVNRLRIFKLTLLATVVVAAISLLYNVVNRVLTGPAAPEAPAVRQTAPADPERR